VVSFTLEGDLGRLRVAAPRAPRRADRLWEHTCCEIFIGRKDLPAYHEFNLAPSGEWAAYAFAGYRSGIPLAHGELDPRIDVRRAAGRLEMQARIRLDRLGYGGSLSIGLSAVVEDEHGALSYWALRHPPGKPDFHDREAFALELDAAGH
jgi:hypothetical protein